VETLRTTAVAVSTTAGTGGLMLRGLIANLLNPKALVFYAVLLPGFVRTGFGPAWVQMLALGLGHIAISVIVHLGIVFGVAQAVSAWPASRRCALRWLSAGGLVAVALWLAVSY
jgi:threonine/homoserine/homoserine lactone efflux protein